AHTVRGRRPGDRGRGRRVLGPRWLQPGLGSPGPPGRSALRADLGRRRRAPGVPAWVKLPQRALGLARHSAHFWTDHRRGAIRPVSSGPRTGRGASRVAAAVAACSGLWLCLAGAAQAAGAGLEAGTSFRPLPVVGAPAQPGSHPQRPAKPGQVVGAVGQIAFVSDNLGGNPNVVKVNSDGTNRGALTDCPVSTCPLGSGAPAYSPDGSQVVFV